MAAIITDQIRILNAKNFISNVGVSAYYSFIALPNPSDYQSDWDENILEWLFANGYRILARTRGNILITPEK